jgi:hypothetical protein
LRTAASAVVSADPAAPNQVQLENGMPNPFVGTTTLRFSLPQAMRVRLAIFDVRGRLVRELVNQPSEPAGPHSIIWDGGAADGRRVASGTYFARLETPGESITRPIVFEH